MKYLTEEEYKGTGRQYAYVIYFIVRGQEDRDPQPKAYFDNARHARNWAKCQSDFFMKPIIKCYIGYMLYDHVTEHYTLESRAEL